MPPAANGALGRFWLARGWRAQLALICGFGALGALGQAPFSLPALSLLGFALAFGVFRR